MSASAGGAGMVLQDRLRSVASSSYLRPDKSSAATARPRLPSLRHILLEEPPLAATNSDGVREDGSFASPFHTRRAQLGSMQDAENGSYEGSFRLGLQMLAPAHTPPSATLQQKSWELALDLESNMLILQRTRRYSFPSSFEHLAHLGQPFPVLRDTIVHPTPYYASADDMQDEPHHHAFSLDRVSPAQLDSVPRITDYSLPNARLAEDTEMQSGAPLESNRPLPPLASGMSSMRVSSANSNPPPSTPLYNHLLPSPSSDNLFSCGQTRPLPPHHSACVRARQDSPAASRDEGTSSFPYNAPFRHGRQSSGLPREETHSAPQVVMSGSSRLALESADAIAGPVHNRHLSGSMGQDRGLALAKGYESEDSPFANVPFASRRTSVAGQSALPPLVGTRQSPTFPSHRMAGEGHVSVPPAVSGRKRPLEDDEPESDLASIPSELGTLSASRQSYSGRMPAPVTTQPSGSQRHHQLAVLRPLGTTHHAPSAADGAPFSFQVPAIPPHVLREQPNDFTGANYSSPAASSQNVWRRGGDALPRPTHAPLLQGPQHAQRVDTAHEGHGYKMDQSDPGPSVDADQLVAGSTLPKSLIDQQTSGARTPANIEEEERDAALRLALLAQAATMANDPSGSSTQPSRAPQDGRIPATQSPHYSSQATGAPQSHTSTSSAGAAMHLQLLTATDASSAPTALSSSDVVQPENDEQHSTSRLDGLAGHGRYGCDVCHKRFTRPSALAVHYHMHTGARPFPCAVCHRSFSVNSNLKRHLRTHTKAERVGVGLE